MWRILSFITSTFSKASLSQINNPVYIFVSRDVCVIKLLLLDDSLMLFLRASAPESKHQAHTLLLQRRRRVRGAATLDAFISSPASPPFMNDCYSRGVFSQEPDQPSAWQMAEITSNEECEGSQKKVWAKHTALWSRVKISQLKISPVSLRKMSHSHSSPSGSESTLSTGITSKKRERRCLKPSHFHLHVLFIPADQTSNQSDESGGEFWC